MEFIDELEKIKREEIPFDSKTKEKFISIYGMKFGHKNAERFYEEQSAMARDIIISSESLKKCSGFSIFNAFIAVAINGLSLEKNSTTQCYIEPRSVAIGVKPNMIVTNLSMGRMMLEFTFLIQRNSLELQVLKLLQVTSKLSKLITPLITKLWIWMMLSDSLISLQRAIPSMIISMEFG